ncbi:phage tail protein [Enterobacter sp.]|uniref:phage tail protein n=1 Tax=Enterobacter sp. TaxID=42895 RepID=UPI00296F9372|nr:phage tail protein [Enterobacter sp.]
MMMTLGLFVFTLKTVPYQELQLQKQWRHASNGRIGKRPILQFLGPDTDTITLSGMLMPEITGGTISLLILEQMAETGKGWPLIGGDGTIYGAFVIESIFTTKSEFLQDGAARKIDFTITLKRVDESLASMMGDLSDQLTQLKDSAINLTGGLLS